MTTKFLLVAFFAVLTASTSAFAETSSADTKYAPSAKGAHFLETFQEADHAFVASTDDKYADQKYDIVADKNGLENDMVLHLNEKAKHYGLSAVFPNGPLVSESADDDFVLQYEVRLTNGLECGGAYLKVLTEDAAEKILSPESSYVVMFGPDKCGSTNKVHFILKHQNPVSKEWEEKHLKNPPSVMTDRSTHLYTLVVRSDNSFDIKIDGESVKSGNLLEDMDPPINPEAFADDPEDVKPEDWVDEKHIDNPEAVKPDDWDDDAPQVIPDMSVDKPSGWVDDAPLEIPDPEAEMPEDWDEEEDGDWEAPLVTNPVCAVGCGEWKRPEIRNPEYRGVWAPDVIDNPDYQGEWKPAQIENPYYFEDSEPWKMAPMGGVAVEIWTMSDGVTFDNVLVAQSEDLASTFAASTFDVKLEMQKVNAASAKAEAQKAAREGLWESGKPLDMAQFVVLTAIQEYPVQLAIGALVGVGLFVVVVRFLCCGSDEEPYVAEEVPKSAPKKKAENKKEDGPEDSKEKVAKKTATADDGDAGEEEPKGTTVRKRRSNRKKRNTPKIIE